MAERRDYERIQSLKPSHRRKVVTDNGQEFIEVGLMKGENFKTPNGGAGRGRAAQDKRAARKLRNKRARASKRA